MGTRSILVAMTLSLGLAATACGGAHAKTAADETQSADPWKDYKGTFASPGAASPSTASASPAEKRTAKADAKDASAKESKSGSSSHAEPLTPSEDPPPSLMNARKASRGTIRGESVSLIGVEALADASKGALKTKVVSSKITVGAQYEQLQVLLKGASVQIVRPATAPDARGPEISSPKARSILAKSESGWYDPDADVVVVVSAAKKPAAQKALGHILTR